MEKKQFLRHSVFLILFCGLMACQDYSLDHEGIVHNLNPIGKAFMQRLKEAPDWSAGWKEVSLKGEVLPNEAALLYGGGYGWHYVLPLVEGKVIIGLVIYPIVDIGENEGPGEGRLGKPIVRVGLEIIEDVGAGSFLNTNSFNKWKSHNLTVSKEVTEAQYKWGQYAIKNNIVQTRTSKGYYYCYYELEYENYIGDDGNAIIVGMAPIAIQEVFHKIADQMPVRFGVTVYKDYVELTDLTQDMMIYYLDKVAIHFKILNASFKVVYIFGRDSNGNETDEYPDYGDIGGGGSGGNSGGGGSGGPNIPENPNKNDTTAHNEIREVMFIVSGITTGEQAVVKIGLTDEMYYVPLYKAELSGVDANGNTLTSSYEVIRFGVKSINDVSVIVGLADENIYTIQGFLPGKYGSAINGDAWQIYGNFLIHVGPKDLEQGVNAYGCIEICNSKMTDFNQKVLQFSNAADGNELISSGKFKLYIQSAIKPALVPKK